MLDFVEILKMKNYFIVTEMSTLKLYFYGILVTKQHFLIYFCFWKSKIPYWVQLVSFWIHLELFFNLQYADCWYPSNENWPFVKGLQSWPQNATKIVISANQMKIYLLEVVSYTIFSLCDCTYLHILAFIFYTLWWNTPYIRSGFPNLEK